jgi:mono/diheme cytochrome c family protein
MSARAGMMRLASLLGSFAALLTVSATGCANVDHLSPGDFVRGFAQGEATALEHYDGKTLTPAQRGAVVFRYSDFSALNTDTLETYATPWRIAAAAIALREVELHGGELSLARVQEKMRSFGFLYPQTVGNWPAGLDEVQPPYGAPLGMAVGTVSRSLPPIRLTAANLTCAACHSGPTYDAQGRPDVGRAWIGAPNTSINLEAYVLALYDAFKAEGGDEAKLFAAVRTLFPDTTEQELSTIRTFVMPRVTKRMEELAARGRPLEFVNGAPGTTNGVAALRMQIGTLPADSYETAKGFTSTPDLGLRGFRSALLYDGAYAPAGEAPWRSIRREDITDAHYDGLARVAAFFTVPSMGVHPDHAVRAIDEADATFDFLRDYAPPRFPGQVDRAMAGQGRALFVDRCASCHGRYDDSLERPMLMEFPNWIGPFDTDPARHEAIDVATTQAIARTAFGRRLVSRATGQYAAPPLSGLWLSAPYLHNGTVPTLWQLMTPAERPARFMVGGHALDYRDVGIAGATNAAGDYVYPEGYQPWSAPAMIDTRQRGFGNQGHAAQFSGLSDAEKRALIEYLKLL